MQSRKLWLSNPIETLFIISMIGIVAFCTYSVSNQRKPENATLAQLHDAGSIKIIVYDPHHQHHSQPSLECPDRRFIAYIPKIKGIKAKLTVSELAANVVLREQTKHWQWTKATELRNGRVETQSIGIRDFSRGTYRARLTVEKNGKKITVSAKGLLTIPDLKKPAAPALSGFARRTAVRRFFLKNSDVLPIFFLYLARGTSR